MWFSLTLLLYVLGLGLHPGFEFPDSFALHGQLDMGVEGIDFLTRGVAHEGFPHVLHNARFHEPGVEGVAKIVKAEVTDACPADRRLPGGLDLVDGTAFEGENQPRKLNQSAADKKPREETAQIAICYYGQKFGHFLTLPSEFLAWARRSPSRGRLRFYNFGGNPMMARLANGENVHAVFEHVGQFPHDAAPGAFIGLQAGAHLVSLSGKRINANDLAQSLMTPSGAELQYVLASTKEIRI
jgi:hypothetical protein